VTAGRLEIRRAHDRREVALELVRDLGIEPARFEAMISRADNPERAASSLRAYLGVSPADQRGWKGPYGPFNSWRSILERHGVLAFQARGSRWMRCEASRSRTTRCPQSSSTWRTRKTTTDFYQKKRQEFIEEYRRRRQEGDGFAPPDAVAVGRAGNFFTRLVLESYHLERITSGHVAEYLDVKLKHLQKIERAAALGGPAA
jgi:hypothetical protein